MAYLRKEYIHVEPNEKSKFNAVERKIVYNISTGNKSDIYYSVK